MRVASFTLARGWDPESGPQDFLATTVRQAHLVLDAEDDAATYDAGLDFSGLALRAMAATPQGEYIAATPAALSLIWGELTDEMDAPGTGSPEQDAAAVRRMKKAAGEWLAVVNSPADRAAYCDRWVYEECGYRRQ